MPDPSIETDRVRHPAPHRRAGGQADRLPGHLGQPVDADHRALRRRPRHVLEDSAAILSRANQALPTLERYKLRLDEVTGTLSALEIEDLVTVRDVAAVAAAPGDGPPDQRRDRRLRRRARHRRPAAHAAAGRAHRRRRHRPRAGHPRLPAEAGAQRPHRRGGARRADEPRLHRAARPRRRRQGARLLASSATPSTPRSARAATGCCPRSRACPAPSSTAWSTTSAACRSCSPPASTTCRPSRASARRRARAVREGLSRLAESSILERYVYPAPP